MKQKNPFNIQFKESTFNALYFYQYFFTEKTDLFF